MGERAYRAAAPSMVRRCALSFTAAMTMIGLSFAAPRISSALASMVTLSPGNNIQSAVRNNPPGTTFVLRPGLYRETSLISLKDGDSFIGQAGADLNGSKVLAKWTKVSIGGVQYWTTLGGTPLPTTPCDNLTGICCDTQHPGCNYVQNLYVDNIDYIHVTALANVVSGSWYYAYDPSDGAVQNNIYLFVGDNPNLHTVELSDQNYAFHDYSSDITIQNLIIEKYAAPISCAAVEPQGPDWLIRNNEIRLNHGFGVKVKAGGDNVQVLSNKVHDNGQGGMGAGAINGGLFDSNQVVHNNIDGILFGFEGVGTKFAGTNLMISRNRVHDNLGIGLFTDSGGTFNTYDHNTSYNNLYGGIRYEISRYGTIENNTVYGNQGHEAQITYTGSDHGRITGNLVTDNIGNGGIAVWNILGTTNHQNFTVYKVTDMQVTGNTIILNAPTPHLATGLIDVGIPLQPSIFSDPTNIWANNTYEVATLPWTAKNWAWGENGGNSNNMTFSSWLSELANGDQLVPY
jgi:parallel beta-helix repeat protein